MTSGWPFSESSRNGIDWCSICRKSDESVFAVVMGFLRVWGVVIIFSTLIGFVIGVYESVVLSNGVIAVVSLLGLLGGIYIGYLGPKTEDLESRLDALDSKGKPMATSQQSLDAFQCATCGATFTSEAQLDEHTIQAHIDFKN